MRVECASCHQMVSPALAINSANLDAKVDLTCPSCGAKIPKAASASGVTDDEIATTTPMPRITVLDDRAASVKLATTPPPFKDEKGPECPKCGAPLKVLARACASCGLATERMATWKSERDLAVPAEIKAAWDAVLAGWSTEAKHDALFHLVAARGEYGWAAGRYREQARERAGDPVAPKQMDRIRKAIEATMVVSATAREKPGASPYKNTATLLAVLIVVLIVGMAYMFIKSRKSTEEEPPLTQPRPPASQVR